MSTSSNSHSWPFIVIPGWMHRQRPSKSFRGFVFAIQIKYSEKKHSPLSGGRGSTSVKGSSFWEGPACMAMPLMYASSVWMKNITALSYAVGIFFLTVFSGVTAISRRLCRIDRLNLAVPVRLMLSAKEVLIPQLPK